MTPSEEVRARVDIVQLISEYVPLKKAGRLYKACCPFHQEKTPSFAVYPEGHWRCFGACATGGDIFSFVMKMESLSFAEALERLAARAGVTLRERTADDVVKQSKRERLLAALRAATDFYHTQLTRTPGASEAREYLKTRGFGTNDAGRFELGWAPDDWTALAEALATQGFSEDELLAAGLVRPREGGGVYDTFRGRLIIPIANSRGQPIGFGARTLDPAGVPKYINSPQSEVFDKSRTVFGLHLAAKAIREAGEVVVVEGYTDVMRAHQAGYANVVASMGTALTEDQLAGLKRFAKKIILALDTDAAGQAATLRGLEVAQTAGGGEVMPVLSPDGLVRFESRLKIDMFVASLSGGKDPDEILREHPETWPRFVADARPVMDYLFETLLEDLDLTDPRGKTTAADRLLPLIGALDDPVAQAAWASRLAQRLHVDERALAARLAQETTRTAGQRARRAAAARPRGERRSLASHTDNDAPAEEGAPIREIGATHDSATSAPQSAAPLDHDDAAPLPNFGLADSTTHLVAYVLGHLLIDPRRYKALTDALKSADQNALSPDDFDQSIDRNLLEAIRFAVHGAPPPDLPAEHRLDALPMVMARYAEALKALAKSEFQASESAQIDALRTSVFRLREANVHQRLKQLRSLQDASDDAGKVALGPEIAALGKLHLTLRRLLAPERRRDEGKVDRGVR